VRVSARSAGFEEGGIEAENFGGGARGGGAALHGSAGFAARGQRGGGAQHEEYLFHNCKQKRPG
jgi:hypothetical protein